MITFSLQSGSNGNAIYVEAGDVRLIFDAGISGRSAAARAARHGRSLHDCDALIISHNHSDHTRCAGIFHRKFGLPIYVSPRVWRAIRPNAGAVTDIRPYEPGRPLVFDGVTVHTIRTPHDGIDPVCFVVEHDGRRLGILTDLGRPFPALRDILGEVDAAYLESNYDPEMLALGSYPERLKRRIAGNGGHLSNAESADLADTCACPRLQWLAVAHLSEQNNRPDLALDSHRSRIGSMFPVHLASRYEAGALLEV